MASNNKRIENLDQVLTPRALEVLNKFSYPKNKHLRRSDINAAFVKDALITALRETRGNVSLACNAVQVSRKSFDNYLIGDPIFAELVAEIKEANIDYAEDKLRQNIDRGFETSIIFFLKTQGKRRGYAESSDAVGYDESILSGQIEMSDDQLINEINDLRARLNADDLTVGGFNMDDYEIVEDLDEDDEIIVEDIVLKPLTERDKLKFHRPEPDKNGIIEPEFGVNDPTERLDSMLKSVANPDDFQSLIVQDDEDQSIEEDDQDT